VLLQADIAALLLRIDAALRLGPFPNAPYAVSAQGTLGSVRYDRFKQ
jgi:hypothetical protein